MTQQHEIIDDPNYIAVLDHGFVGIVDHMGDDTSIVQAARVSYGAGTKSVRQDRGLIRYMIRHKHTSPVEMCEVKFHIRLPIFVMRQLVRHRTANLNEYSGRYSVMSDEFYMPGLEVIQPQSQDNKQGRSGSLTDNTKEGVRWLIKGVYDFAYKSYQALLGEKLDEDGTKIPEGDEIETDTQLFEDDFPGISRELARTTLPVGNYTECYWKQDLHNLFHLLKLRTDPHAQYEIRVFADAMYKLIKPIFPLACEGFEDYIRDAVSLSRMEVRLVTDAMNHIEGFKGLIEDHNHDMAALAKAYDLTEREIGEFRTRFEI